MQQPPTERPALFVSYAHDDAEFVSRIVGLLRAAPGSDPVFLDRDSIRPGEDWEKALYQSIEACESMFVFWCEHAGDSSWVRQEYTYALQLDKRVVPVRIDDSKLPQPLSRRQCIDLRGLVTHRSGDATGYVGQRPMTSHTFELSAPSKPPGPKLNTTSWGGPTKLTPSARLASLCRRFEPFLQTRDE